MGLVSAINFYSWVENQQLLDVLVGGSPKKPRHQKCTGIDCFEVFSCHGMRDATQHIRQPIMFATGFIFFPIGAYAAHMGLREPLQIFAVYVTISAVVHAGLVIFDAMYFKQCDMYTTNMIRSTLVNRLLPPSPLLPAARHELRSMTSFPIAEVDKLTDNFPGFAWYLTFAISGTLVIAYAAREARLLVDLFERGPLGLGVHYGLGQWDELINHDAIRMQKSKNARSQFVDDAKLPLQAPIPDGERTSWGWGLWAGESYGTLNQEEIPAFGEHDDTPAFGFGPPIHAQDQYVGYLGDEFDTEENQQYHENWHGPEKDEGYGFENKMSLQGQPHQQY